MSLRYGETHPQSKGIVENLVGYAKDDLLLPLTIETRGGQGWPRPTSTRRPGAPRSTQQCTRRSARSPTSGSPRSGSCSRVLPSLRLQVGPRPVTRKVDKLSCIRFGSARYSVPNALIGSTVTVLVDEGDRRLRVIGPVTGEVHAEHLLVAPGETSIVDAHYGRPRPDRPARRARARTPAEREFLALGPVAEQFLTGAAAAGVTKLAR